MKKSFTKKDIDANIAVMLECFPQVNEGLNSFRKMSEKIAENYEKLAYPYHPNWSYCIPLAPNYTLKDGTVVDIGVFIDKRWLKEYPESAHYGISANFVTSNEGHDYYSGTISPTSEMSKVALKVLLWMEIIDQSYIMNCIADHNNFLNKFMNSDLTLWDMQRWIDDHIEKEG